MIAGFPPIEAPDAKALILGTCPSEASLLAGRYYAHPRNAFWPIIERVLGDGASTLSYEERCRLLTAGGIALWDVLHAAERQGSLDASIERGTEIANDFGGFFAGHPCLERVLFNGATAESLWRRLVAPAQPVPHGIETLRLPSTSPAHAGMGFDEKCAAWRRALLPAGSAV